MDNHNSINLGASFRLSPLSCVYPHFLTPWASQLGRNREIGDQTEKRCSPPKFAIGKLLKWKWDLELLAITWDCVSSWVSSPGWKRVSSRVKRIALDFTQLAEEKEWKRYLNSVWGEKDQTISCGIVFFQPHPYIGKINDKVPQSLCSTCLFSISSSIVSGRLTSLPSTL